MDGLITGFQFINKGGYPTVTNQENFPENNSRTGQKYCKEAFENISGEKRERILSAAAAEFAALGFSAANINVIARKADISIGSMYNYFESKEALFLTVGERGYRIILEVLSEINLDDGDIFDKFEKMFRAVQTYARKYRVYNQIYLDMASEGISHLSSQLSNTMEALTADYFKSLLSEAMGAGIIDSTLDMNVTAFCLDNLIITLQYSYTSPYLAERMKIFAGEDALENDEKMIQGIMRFIRNALRP